MGETCPFLVPLHPQRPEGQSDKDWYQALGYKYEANEVEKQDKYLKRLSGVARLYAALSVVYLPKSSTSNIHPQPLQKLWHWLASLSSRRCFCLCPPPGPGGGQSHSGSPLWYAVLEIA